MCTTSRRLQNEPMIPPIGFGNRLKQHLCCNIAVECYVNFSELFLAFLSTSTTHYVSMSLLNVDALSFTGAYLFSWCSSVGTVQMGKLCQRGPKPSVQIMPGCLRANFWDPTELAIEHEENTVGANSSYFVVLTPVDFHRLRQKGFAIIGHYNSQMVLSVCKFEVWESTSLIIFSDVGQVSAQKECRNQTHQLKDGVTDLGAVWCGQTPSQNDHSWHCLSDE